LDAFIKTAQYLAGLTTQQDVWSETGKLLVNFWGEDLGGLGERGSDGEMAIRNWTLSAGFPQGMDLVSEVQQDIAEVLDSGFLTWRLISSLPEPLVIAFLPITQENQVTGVLLVGHKTSGSFPKDLLNTYLALAGLVGTTAGRLASEVELRKHRQYLEQRTEELVTANYELEAQIAQRKEAEEAVTAERQRLYDVLETLPACVVLLTPDYHVPFANRVFRERYGESHGMRCFEYLFGRTEPCENCETFTVLNTMVPHRWEWTGPDDRNYDVYGYPFTDVDGSRLILEMRIDITERKRADEALKQMLVDLERSNADLEQFAYVASHDLQEPLRNVASCVQLLGKKYKGKFDEDADQLLSYAAESSIRMKSLIIDLLAYSRISTRGNPFRPTSCEDVLDKTLAQLRPSIEEAAAAITHDPLPVVVGDFTQLGEVFQNLIGNAIKFRREEPLHVHVSAARRDSEWVFSVRDNGIGMAARHLERIFVIFQRLHKRSEYEGTGMGLAIVKKIIERHQGTIWVESQPRQGTTFYFTIPAKEMNT